MWDVWSFGRATRFGLTAGLASALLWPIYAIVQEPIRPIFMIALAVTALCGASILIMTGVDILTVRRSRSVLPARMFDLAMGLVLVAPSALGLSGLLPG